MNDKRSSGNDPLCFVPFSRDKELDSREDAPQPADERWLTCPRCGKKFRRSQTQAPPFCSKQCRQADLNRWLSEEYTVETLNPQFDEDEGRIE